MILLRNKENYPLIIHDTPFLSEADFLFASQEEKTLEIEMTVYLNP